MNKKIKIFLAYHKDTVRIQSEILTPIHVGRANSTKFLRESLLDIIGDDTGNNISSKNENFCELTAQYWAWKNVKSEYIGFMHYRRLLSFNTSIEFKEDKWGCCCDKYFSDMYRKKYLLYDNNISEIVKKYDIITCKKWDVRNAGSKNNYYHYKMSDNKLFIKDYDMALSILLKKYPEFKESVKEYNESVYGYYTNIFIMKYEIFNYYCNWLFDILFELEKIIDISKYNTQEKRVFGYISEWLFGIFITYFSKRYSIKELQRTIINQPEINIINVCFSSDEKYVKYLSVAISSLLINKDKYDYLQIYILDGGISEKNKNKIQKFIKKYSNVVIKFLSINKDKFSNCPIHTIPGTHLSLATYYRLILSSLIHEDKVIYLDCDLIVKTSLKKLFNTIIDNYYIAGVIDILFTDNTRRLQLSKYVSAGVLLINLKLWREKNIERDFFNFIDINKNKILYHDQDVINCVCQEKILYLDKFWNAQTCEYSGAYEGGWNKIGEKAYIIHFISDRKPWVPGNKHPFKDEYNKYLNQSPLKYNSFYNYFINIISKIIYFKKTSENFYIYLKKIVIFKKFQKGQNFRYTVCGIPLFACKEYGNILKYHFLFFSFNKMNIESIFYNKIQNLEYKIDNIGNRFNENLERMQNINLEYSYYNMQINNSINLLKNLHTICESNRIQYWLDLHSLKEICFYGRPITLKQIAIGMLREDFDKLLNVLQNDHNFRVSSYIWIPKLEKQSMCCHKFSYKKIESNVFIDIFIYDICPADITYEQIKICKQKCDQVIFNLEKTLFEQTNEINRSIFRQEENFNKFYSVFEENSKKSINFDNIKIYWSNENFKKDVALIDNNDIFPLDYYYGESFIAYIPCNISNYLKFHNCYNTKYDNFNTSNKMLSIFKNL